MTEKKQTKEISLKQALIEGGLVDLFLFLVSAVIMCWMLQVVAFLALIAHVSTSAYLACRFKGGISTSGIFFIRFGAFCLILIGVVLRGLTSIFFQLMNIDWY
jgi:hypothetical protein